MKWKNILTFLSVCLFLILSFIPFSYSTITFSSTTYFQGTSGAWFNFSTEQTFNTYERSGSWHYFNGKGVAIVFANVTITNWLTSNWLNYTATAAGTQYFYYFDLPSAVYLNGVLREVGDGWSYSSGTITITSSTLVAISWAEAPPEPPPPPPYPSEPDELTYYPEGESGGSGFRILVPNESQIAFETIAPEFNYTFIIYCTTGTWHGINGYLSTDFNGGTLGFHANDTSTLRLYSLSSDEITVGAMGGTLTKTATNDYSLTVTDGNDLSITWYHPLPSYLDYTMFGVGMFGVGLLIGCPIWAIKKVKDEGILEPDSIQRVGLAAMLMLIGFGLVVAWLWL